MRDMRDGVIVTGAPVRINPGVPPAPGPVQAGTPSLFQPLPPGQATNPCEVLAYALLHPNPYLPMQRLQDACSQWKAANPQLVPLPPLPVPPQPGIGPAAQAIGPDPSDPTAIAFWVAYYQAQAQGFTPTTSGRPINVGKARAREGIGTPLYRSFHRA